MAKKKINTERPDEGQTRGSEINPLTGQPVIEPQPQPQPNEKPKTKGQVEKVNGPLILFALIGGKSDLKQSQEKLRGLDDYVAELEKDKMINQEKIDDLYNQFYNGETKLKHGKMSIEKCRNNRRKGNEFFFLYNK